MTTKPYPLSELAAKWEREQLTAEQMIAQRAQSAIGQLLAHINLLQQAIHTILAQPATSNQALDVKAQQPSARPTVR